MKMNKGLTAIFVMVVFLISILPIGISIGPPDSLSSLKTAEAEKECSTSEDCPQTRCLGAKPECVNGKCVMPRCAAAGINLPNPEAISAGQLVFRQRQIAKEKLQNAKENYEQAKLRLQSAKQNALQHRVEFMKSKEQLNTCGLNDSETCKQKREDVQANAKNYLLETADRIIATLEKIKAKAQESEDLSEEEVTGIIADIDGEIAALQEAKNTLETSENKEELIEAAKTIKQEWNKIKVRARLHIEQMKGAKLGNILARAEHLQERLEAIKLKLQEQGQDVSDLDGLITTFSTQIASAKEKYLEATDLFKQAKEGDNAELVKQAQEAHKEAEQAIKEAHATLKEIVKAIKAKNNAVLDEPVEETG